MLDYQIGLIAEKLIDLDPFGARDADATKESVIHDIETDPVSIISYLLDYIDELQEV